jgi:hypothetical protein
MDSVCTCFQCICSYLVCLKHPFNSWNNYYSEIWILQAMSRTPWRGDQPIARSLPTYRTTRTQNKCTQTSMPRVEFEPTIPAFEREKIFRASDRAATVTGYFGNLKDEISHVNMRYFFNWRHYFSCKFCLTAERVCQVSASCSVDRISWLKFLVAFLSPPGNSRDTASYYTMIVSFHVHSSSSLTVVYSGT